MLPEAISWLRPETSRNSAEVRMLRERYDEAHFDLPKRNKPEVMLLAAFLEPSAKYSFRAFAEWFRSLVLLGLPLLTAD